MKIAQHHHHQKLIVSVILLWMFVVLLSSFRVSAKSKKHPISDNEIRAKKTQCYEDIDSGLWGERCMSSNIAKENCALQCVSHVCYQLIYESDPLEEGEKDYIRGQEYKYCLHKDSLGESLEGVKGSYAY